MEVIFHTGLRVRKLFFAFSPGLLFRLSGYSHALTAKFALGARFSPVYGLFYFNWIRSFNDTLLFDPNLNTHNANGTGGSFARLAGSPTNLSFGFKAGVFVVRNYSVEIDFEKTVSGSRAPNYFRFALNVRGVFDFFEEDRRKTIQPVPFNRPDPMPEEKSDKVIKSDMDS